MTEFEKPRAFRKNQRTHQLRKEKRAVVEDIAANHDDSELREIAEASLHSNIVRDLRLRQIIRERLKYEQDPGVEGFSIKVRDEYSKTELDIAETMGVIPEEIHKSGEREKLFVLHFLGISEFQLKCYLDYRYTRLSDDEALFSLFKLCGRRSYEHANDLKTEELEREIVKRNVWQFLNQWHWFEVDDQILHADVEKQIEFLTEHLLISKKEVLKYISKKYPKDSVRDQIKRQIADFSRVKLGECFKPEHSKVKYSWYQDDAQQVLT